MESADIISAFIIFDNSIDNSVFPEAVGPTITINKLLSFPFEFFINFIETDIYQSGSSMRAIR